MQPALPPPIEDLDSLLAPLYAACKPRARWRVGTEAEKFGVDAATGRPAAYDGTHGVRAILQQLVTRHGWFEEREYAGGDVIALRRGDASITLEPGAQLELSGAPLGSIHQTCAELRNHMTELRDVSEPSNVVWLGLGYHPVATPDQLPWVPKLRYQVMREYLPTRGSRALDMMRRTCTVQANLDYSSERDAMRKLRLALAAQPIVTAMFANSPFVEGRIGSHCSERAQVWLDVDPDRTGLLPFAWEATASFRSYVEWALDVPMFLVKRGERLYPSAGLTFRRFMHDGWQGLQATLPDWEAHLNSLFPEVRLKQTLEVRGADGQSQPMVCAIPALWKGLLYDTPSCEQLERLVAPLDHDTVQRARPAIARQGLRAVLAKRPVLEWALQVCEIAVAGLRRQSHLNRERSDETVHLERVRELLQHGQTPSEALLAKIDRGHDLIPQVLRLGQV